MVRLVGRPVDQVVDRPLSIRGQGYRQEQYRLTAHEVLVKIACKRPPTTALLYHRLQRISSVLGYLKIFHFFDYCHGKLPYPSAYPSWPSPNIFGQGFSVSAKSFALMPSEILRLRQFIVLMLPPVVPGSRTSPAARNPPGPRRHGRPLFRVRCLFYSGDVETICGKSAPGKPSTWGTHDLHASFLSTYSDGRARSLVTNIVYGRHHTNLVLGLSRRPPVSIHAFLFRGMGRAITTLPG